MKVRRKSLWRSKNVSRQFKKRANQRVAKERKRIERIHREENLPEISCHCPDLPKSSGFKVVITRLSDGEQVQFTTFRNIWERFNDFAHFG